MLYLINKIKIYHFNFINSFWSLYRLMDYIIPIFTYNAILYSLTTISASITSTQNIFKFITEHKESDYIIWQRQLETTDLYNKLNITSALIKEIIRKNIQDDADKVIQELSNPLIEITEQNDYSLVELQKSIFDFKIPEYIKLSLLSLIEVINKLNHILEKIHDKIIKHQKFFLKQLFTINIHDDVQHVISLTKLFNNRLNLLFELLKVMKTL